MSNSNVVLFAGIIVIAYSKLIQTKDTWKTFGKDRFILDYRLQIEADPQVTWWHKSLAPKAQYKVLHEKEDEIQFYETNNSVSVNGMIDYVIRLVIRNTTESYQGYYKVEINNQDNLTASFFIDQMPVSKLVSKSTNDEAAVPPKNDIFLIVGIAAGLVLIMTIVVVVLVAKLKVTKSGKSKTPTSVEAACVVAGDTSYIVLDNAQGANRYPTGANISETSEIYSEPFMKHPTSSLRVHRLRDDIGRTVVRSISGSEPDDYENASQKISKLSTPSCSTYVNKTSLKDLRDSCSVGEDPSCNDYENVGHKLSKQSCCRDFLNTKSLRSISGSEPDDYENASQKISKSNTPSCLTYANATSLKDLPDSCSDGEDPSCNDYENVGHKLRKQSSCHDYLNTKRFKRKSPTK